MTTPKRTRKGRRDAIRKDVEEAAEEKAGALPPTLEERRAGTKMSPPGRRRKPPNLFPFAKATLKCGTCMWFEAEDGFIHRGRCVKFKATVGAMTVCDEWEDGLQR